MEKMKMKIYNRGEVYIDMTPDTKWVRLEDYTTLQEWCERVREGLRDLERNRDRQRDAAHDACMRAIEFRAERDVLRAGYKNLLSRKCDGLHAQSTLCLDPQCWQGEDNPVIKRFGVENGKLRQKLDALCAENKRLRDLVEFKD
jgi:hypothetical protein